MAGARGLQGIALAAVVTGGLLVWSGLKGWNLSTTAKDLITGQDPTGQANAHPISDATGPLASSGGGSTGGAGGGASSSALSDIALADKGHAYLYGGAPGTDGKHPWDCSSAVNWWVGHKAALAIPGYGPGKYTGAVHGPPSGAWLVTPLCTTIKKADIMAGDIMVWPTHVGIAVSNTQMISALNEHLGTLVTSIHDGSPGGELLVPRRLKATGTAGGAGPH